MCLDLIILLIAMLFASWFVRRLYRDEEDE